MFTLDATTKSVEVILSGNVTTNQLPIIASWVDKTSTTFTPGSQTTQTNNTTAVTAIPAPAASTQREGHSLNIYNDDTASAIVTVRENDNGTFRKSVKVTLAVGDVLMYSHADVWKVMNSSGETKLTATSFSGVMPAINGGTGFGSYAVGDILYADTTTSLAKLPDVAAGSFLRSGGVSTAPAWSTTVWTNSASQGDLLYASAANTYSNLAKHTTATRYLANTGTNNNPNWDQINLTNGVTGILPAANGGTNSAFVQFTGPATTVKTFTLPNADSSIAVRNSFVFSGLGTTFAAGNTYYSCGAVNWQTGDANLARTVVPFAGTAKSLYAKGSSAPGVGQTFTITVMKNLVDTALTCTISGASTSANDTTNTFSVSAGDDVQIKAVTSAGAAASDVSASFIIDGPLS